MIAHLTVAHRITLALAATILVLVAFPAAGMAACANPVACENEKPGAAPSVWQVTGAGDSTIQGYATSMSVNKGGTIRFKIKTTVLELPHRHLPARLLPGQRRAAAAGGHPADGDAAADASPPARRPRRRA